MSHFGEQPVPLSGHKNESNKTFNLLKREVGCQMTTQQQSATNTFKSIITPDVKVVSLLIYLVVLVVVLVLVLVVSILCNLYFFLKSQIFHSRLVGNDTVELNCSIEQTEAVTRISFKNSYVLVIALSIALIITVLVLTVIFRKRNFRCGGE